MTGNQKLLSTIAASTLGFVLLFSAPTTATAVTTNLTAGQTINLGTVIDNGLGVQIGDKLFADFFFDYSDTDNGNIDLTKANVNLTALSNNIGFGVSFTQPLLAQGPVTKNIALNYSATVTDPNFLISDIHLVITGSSGNGGLGTVDEDVYTGGFNGTNVGSIHADTSTPPLSLTDSADIVPPVVELWVQKLVSVTGSNQSASGFATITVIDQTFSQIPEPSTVLLVGLGLLGLVALNRKRQS